MHAAIQINLNIIMLIQETRQIKLCTLHNFIYIQFQEIQNEVQGQIIGCLSMNKRGVMQDGGIAKGVRRILEVIDMCIILIVVMRYAKIVKFYTFSICSLLYTNCNSIKLFRKTKKKNKKFFNYSMCLKSDQSYGSIILPFLFYYRYSLSDFTKEKSLCRMTTCPATQDWGPPWHAGPSV